MAVVVEQWKVAVAASMGLGFADHIATAATEHQVPYAWACALIEQESNGRNVWGHDVGGTFSGCPLIVTRGAFEVFYWLISNGATSNGVGPAQITWRGYFDQMLREGRHPWDPADNIDFGLRLLSDTFLRVGSWPTAAGHYNGGTKPNMTYAADVTAKRQAWWQRFAASAPAG